MSDEGAEYPVVQIVCAPNDAPAGAYFPTRNKSPACGTEEERAIAVFSMSMRQRCPGCKLAHGIAEQYVRNVLGASSNPEADAHSLRVWAESVDANTLVEIVAGESAFCNPLGARTCYGGIRIDERLNGADVRREECEYHHVADPWDVVRTAKLQFAQALSDYDRFTRFYVLPWKGPVS